MKHLNVDDIINFVSLTELNEEALELSAAVNSHIRNCQKCLETVRAFQLIYDEFCSLNSDMDFRKYISDKSLSEDNETVVDILNVTEDFDGDR